MLFTHRKCSPSLPTFLLLLLLGVRLGRKQVGWLCLYWRTAALGFSRRRESRRWWRACTCQLWKISVAEWSHWWKYSALGYAAFLFHLILHETPHTSKCFQGFLRAFKSVQQIGTVKSRASECIWCEWWPVDSDKLNEFVLALSRVTKSAGGWRCVSTAHENQWKVWKCAVMRKYFSRWN